MVFLNLKIMMNWAFVLIYILFHSEDVISISFNKKYCYLSNIQLDYFNLNCHGFYNVSDLVVDGQPWFNISRISPLQLKSSYSFWTFNIDTYRMISYFTNGTRLNLFNLNGLEINSNDVNSNIKFQLFLFESKFNFYYKNSLIRSCKDILLGKNDYLSQALFSTFNLIHLGYQVIHSHRICPLIFKDASIVSLFNFDTQTDSFIYKNFITFEEIDLRNTTIIDLNSHVNILSIAWSDYIRLDNSFLNPDIFKHVSTVFVTGTLKYIGSYTFKNLKKLRQIKLKLLNFITIFKYKIDWIENINYDLRNRSLDRIDYFTRTTLVLLDQYFDGSFAFYDMYTFPNEDFCIFKNFPFNQLVFAQVSLNIDLFVKANCSCTFMWVLSEVGLNNDLAYMDQFSIILGKYCNSSISVLRQRCNFTKSLNNCFNINEPLNKGDIDIYKNDLYDQGMIFYYIVGVYLTPVINFFGLVLNILIIRTYLDKRNNENFDKIHYKYMFYLAISNCLYCLITIFNLISDCPYDIDGLFCSSIHNLLVVKYFKVYVSVAFLNVIRIISNLTYLQFSINRYLLIGKNHSKIFVSIAKISTKKFYLFAFLLGIILSSFKCTIFKSVDDFYKIEYNILIQSTYLDKFDSLGFLDRTANVMIFIIFPAILLIVDVSVIKKFNEFIKSHTKLFTEKKLTGTTENYQNAKIKIHLILIINLIFNFILKLPEVYYLFIGQSLTYTDFGIYFDQFELLFNPRFVRNGIIKTVDLLYSLSILNNFFMFYSYDKKFRESFKTSFRP